MDSTGCQIGTDIYISADANEVHKDNNEGRYERMSRGMNDFIQHCLIKKSASNIFTGTDANTIPNGPVEGRIGTNLLELKNGHSQLSQDRLIGLTVLSQDRVWSSLHCFALLCIALRCIALHCFALLCTALHCFALLCIPLLCFALLRLALLRIALLSIVLHCFAFALLYFSIQFNSVLNWIQFSIQLN